MKSTNLLSRDVPGFNLDTLPLMSLFCFPVMIVAYIFLKHILNGTTLFIALAVIYLLVTSLTSILVGMYARRKPTDSKWRNLV
jgi:archaellum biogenesis protein FlaJ (TadC family)